MQKKFFTLLSCCLFATLATAQQTNVQFTERLVKKMQTSQPNDYLQVILLMKEQANTELLSQRLYAENASLARRSQEVIQLLQTTAETTQKDLLADLRNDKNSGKVKFFDAYWVSNLVVASVQRDYLYELQNRADLMTIDLDGILKLDAVTKSEKVAKAQNNSSEPGACIINAKPLWQMGFTGCGRTVMGMDTGVDGTHPALSSRWKGNFVPSSQAWLDNMTSPFTSTPTDCDGHGTHTVGTMVGLDPATNDTIGIAFGAQWIAAQTICSSPHTSYSIAAFQWAMNPDNNASTTADRPDAINCSWYDPDVTACDATYQTTLTNVEAAGIAVVFSAGNSGPGVGTITNPKSINVSLTNTFTVANVNAQVCGGTYNIASSSSRGPSACGGTGSLNIKPEVSAPGTSVRSAYVGGGYAYLTGTSMAAPHVAGAIALLKEAYPNHTGEQIKLALYNTCTDMGTAGEDNTYGMGMIDVYAAYQYLQTNASSSFYQPIAPCDMRCSGLTTLTGCSGTFSDGSGTFLYPNYSNCKWLISTPAGTAPTLTFSAFDLETNYDYVYVYDGADSLAPLIGTFTGATIPAALTASGNNMFVKFFSDYIVRDNGFVASYSAAPRPIISGPSAVCYGTVGVLTASSTGCSSCSYSWNVSPANTTATYLATATNTVGYSVNMTNVCGTTTSAAFPFTVHKLPTVNAGLDKTACQGTPTTIGLAGTSGISYVWSPTTGLSNPSISNPSATPTSTTTYVLTAINTTTGCYNKDTVKVNINPVATVNAGADKSICVGACTTIGSGSATAGATYTWSPTVPSPNAIVNTVCPTATTTYTLTGVMTATGCTKTDQVVVTVNPKPTANAGADKVLCSGSTTSLGATAVSGVSYSWSPTTSLSSSTSANPVFTAPTISTTTNYTYYVTAYFASTGCFTRDTVLITVNPKPTANAGTDKTICSGASTSIGSSALIGVNYTWTPATALSSTTVANPTASPTSTTTYTVTVSNIFTGCSSSDAVIVTVNPLPTANAGADKTICAGASTSIGSSAVAGVTYTWSPTTALGTPYAATTTAAPTTTTTYTVTAKNSTTGCTKTDAVIVTVNPKPTANAGVDKTICVGGTGTSLGATAVAGMSYAWSPSTGLSSSTVSNPTANPTTTTTYTLTVTNTTTNCTNTDQVLVTVNPQPTANAGLDKTICSGNSTTIGTTGVAGNTYTWSPTTALSSPYADITAANPTATTTYTLTAKVTATGCTKTDQVIVTVNPKPTANAGPDKTITTVGGAVTIGSAAVAGNTYSWTPSLGLNNPTLAIPTASPTSTTTYTLTVTNTTTGCTNSDQVVVTVNIVGQQDGSKPGGNPLTQTQFNVFPNPVENVLNITSDASLTGKYEVVIRNVAGQEILRKAVETNDERLNLQINTLDLIQGVYILNIESSEGNSVHKLIKE